LGGAGVTLQTVVDLAGATVRARVARRLDTTFSRHTKDHHDGLTPCGPGSHWIKASPLSFPWQPIFKSSLQRCCEMQNSEFHQESKSDPQVECIQDGLAWDGPGMDADSTGRPVCGPRLCRSMCERARKPKLEISHFECTREHPGRVGLEWHERGLHRARKTARK
jgi:hypothetical protein